MTDHLSAGDVKRALRLAEFKPTYHDVMPLDDLDLDVESVWATCARPGSDGSATPWWASFAA